MKQSFDKWFAKVQAAVRARGLELLDLPDCPFYDWYEDGVSPKSAAARAIRGAME